MHRPTVVLPKDRLAFMFCCNDFSDFQCQENADIMRQNIASENVPVTANARYSLHHKHIQVLSFLKYCLPGEVLEPAVSIIGVSKELNQGKSPGEQL